MSIAVSALIRPSRIVRLALAAMGTAILACGAWLFLFAFPEPSPFGIMALVLPLVLAGIALLLSAFRSRKSFRLDISGLGQIRLREHYTGAAARPFPQGESGDLQGGRAVRLMGDSTIWPCMLALRLCDASGRRLSLLVLPDSVGRDAFRALFVALRWIARREPESRAIDEEQEGNDTRG